MDTDENCTGLDECGIHILKLAGEGGNSKVYKAINKHGNVVAVKIANGGDPYSIYSEIAMQATW